MQAIGINAANKSTGKDKASGKLQFANKRAEIHWRIREALDPDNDTGIALPPHPKLRADYLAITWKLQSGKIQITDKETIKEETGRSTDYSDAYNMALIDTVPWHADPRLQQSENARRDYRPVGAQSNTRRSHNPHNR